MNMDPTKETKLLRDKGPSTGPVHDDRAQLVHALGPRTGQRMQVHPGAVLGRDAQCEVVVEDDGTSRRHAQLGYDPMSGFFIEDLGSRNGTFVNGVAVKRSHLAFGDKITIGASTVLLFTRDTPLDDQVMQVQKLQMLGELAGGIVHDFNNILAAFTVGMDLLRDLCGADARVGACLRDLDDAARRGAELTGQLMSFARGGTTRYEQVDLAKVATDAVQLLCRMVPRTVVIRPEIEAGVGVYGSSSQMFQVIVNLVSNGADAMPQGGQIVVRVQRSDDKAVVEVTDTGEGMDPHTLERALDPFFTTKPRGHGTGLGLATVDRVVREHRGRLAVSSEPGQGTSVTVRLPFIRVEGGASPEYPVVASLPPGMVVLMVDDDAVVRSITSRVLEAEGAEVLVAAEGLEGLEVFRDHAARIGIVMLDLDLPRMSGEEVLEIMHEIQPEVPVLISSGYVDEDRVRRLGSSGIAGLLSKPFSRASMLAMIAEHVRPPVGAPERGSGSSAGSDPPGRREGTPPASSEVGGAESARVGADTLLESGVLESGVLDPGVVDELRALEQGQPGILAEVTRLYLGQAPAQIEAVEQASDPSRRARAAHLLRSASLSVGAAGVGRIASAIEVAARAGDATDALLPSLRAAFDAVEPVIEALGDAATDAATDEPAGGPPASISTTTQD
ncbi:MAG: ATP-binding protein [Myxococcota bacterium]